MQIHQTADGLAIEIANESETERLGQALAQIIEPNTTIALDGPLGAGKTRLARAIAEALEVDPQAIASPTFVLIHEYEGQLPIYHFDAYRLPNPEAFEVLGATDYFGAGGLCLVEWAERVQSHLPPETWSIRIEPRDTQIRHLNLKLPTTKAEILLALLNSQPQPANPIEPKNRSSSDPSE